jgi:hypothetical protein
MKQPRLKAFREYVSKSKNSSKGFSSKKRKWFAVCLSRQRWGFKTSINYRKRNVFNMSMLIT